MQRKDVVLEAARPQTVAIAGKAHFNGLLGQLAVGADFGYLALMALGLKCARHSSTKAHDGQTVITSAPGARCLVVVG
jgi:hypothetical protein